MAKVTPKATPAPKTAPKAADKAKEKEARAALVAENVSEFTAPLETLHEAEKTRTVTFLEITKKGQELVAEHDFSESEIGDMIRMALAEVGGYDADELVISKENPLGDVIKQHGSDYTELSMIRRLIFPKEEHKKAFAKALKIVEDADGAIGIGRLLEVARKGGDVKLPGKRGRKSESQKQEKQAKDVFATEDDAGTALAGWFQKCEKSDMDIDAIESLTMERLEAYKEAVANREAEKE